MSTRFGPWAYAAFMAAGLTGPVMADSLTVELGHVRNAQGKVVVTLCGDPAGSFPGGCSQHFGAAPAAAGSVQVRIEGLAPGRYAIQAFHDENGNNRPEIPPEGYAFGNDAPWPPSFTAASTDVRGDAQAQVRMVYALSGASGVQGVQPPPRSRGADAPAGIARTDLREQGLYGELYAPAGATKLPAMLLLGGSEGGLDTISAMAVSLAERGYAVLALAYFAEEGLPVTLENIPLEYFDRALAWLRTQPQVDARRIGVLGWSRGSEAALLTAARHRDVRAVVGVAPSGAVWQGLYYGSDRAPGPAWTLDGKPLPALLPDTSAYRPNAPLVGLFQPRFAELQAREDVQIPVHRIRGGILLISGGRDAVWPAARFADHISGRLHAEGHSGRFLHLHYPDAGHAVFVGHPEGPMARALGAAHPAMGGTPAANRAAWQDSWTQALSFLREELAERVR